MKDVTCQIYSFIFYTQDASEHIRGCEKPCSRKTFLTLNSVCGQETFPSWIKYKSISRGASVSWNTFWEKAPLGTPSHVLSAIALAISHTSPFPLLASCS